LTSPDSAARTRDARASASAVIVICTACFVTSSQDVVIKWMSGSYPFHEMQTIRCAAALLCVTAFALREGGARSLAVLHLPMVLLRGALLALASAMFYLTAAAMPYSEAVALYFTMPLWVAVLAGPLLREHVPLHRWAAAGVGFAGVVLILRPSSAVFEPAALLGLGTKTL
jgi:drug/metabolite transporter (DMT)-like permease